VFVVLVTQHTMRMRHITLSSVACLALPYFSTLSHKRYDFFKKRFLHIKCVSRSSLQILSGKFLILRRIQRVIIINVQTSSCKVPIIFVRFYSNLNFLDGFSKHNQTSQLMKIVLVGAEFFHEKGRTDRHNEANSHILQFCKRT
jgi:hypothetical protein